MVVEIVALFCEALLPQACRGNHRPAPNAESLHAPACSVSEGSLVLDGGEQPALVVTSARRPDGGVEQRFKLFGSTCCSVKLRVSGANGPRP